MSSYIPDAKEVLASAGIVHCDGHFVDRKGRHARDYYDLDAFHRDPIAACEIGRLLAFPFRGTERGVQTVVGLGFMGQALAHWTAYHLQIFAGSFRRDRIVTAAYAISRERVFAIHPSWETSVKARRVLLVTDLVASVENTVAAAVPMLREYGAHVVGASTMVAFDSVHAHDFGGITAFHSLANISGERWTRQECPLCAKGIPVRQDAGRGSEHRAPKERNEPIAIHHQ